MCNIIQILVQQVLCCYTTIWYCYNCRSLLIYPSPNLLLFVKRCCKLMVLNCQLPLHKMSLCQDHMHRGGSSLDRVNRGFGIFPAEATLPSGNTWGERGSPCLPCREVGAVGREGSVGIHQGIKRPLASSFVASVWAPGCLGGEVDREHNRMVWDCRGDLCYPGGGRWPHGRARSTSRSFWKCSQISEFFRVSSPVVIKCWAVLVAYLLITNEDMKVFRSWYVKTIAAHGKIPITINEVLKTCLLVGC